MIDREHIAAAFEAQVESMVAAHDTVPEGEMVWAVAAGSGVDFAAVEDVALAWARLGAGAPPSDGASFIAGFLTALRLVERSEVG